MAAAGGLYLGNTLPNDPVYDLATQAQLQYTWSLLDLENEPGCVTMFIEHYNSIKRYVLIL